MIYSRVRWPESKLISYATLTPSPRVHQLDVKYSLLPTAESSVQSYWKIWSSQEPMGQLTNLVSYYEYEKTSNCTRKSVNLSHYPTDNSAL